MAGSVLMTSGILDVKAGAEVEGDILFTSGNVRLGQRAIVRGDVISTSGSIHQTESAQVEGKISTNGVDFGTTIIGSLCVPPLVPFGILLYWLIDQGSRRSMV